jgi:phosphohistidine phosphatase
MDIYLVRHGEARPESEDPRRPLSVRGRRDVEAVARAAADKQISVAAIVHSDKLRARETAEIFARLIVPASGIRQINSIAPEDDPEIAKAEIEASAEPLMIVGHLPHLARLASLLLTGDSERPTVEFSTATIACLSSNGGSWKFSWIISPEDLSRG